MGAHKSSNEDRRARERARYDELKWVGPRQYWFKYMGWGRKARRMFGVNKKGEPTGQGT